MPQCAMWGCHSNTGRNKDSDGKQLSFFGFPKEKERRKAWIHACGRDKFTPRPSDRVCSKHFRAEDMERDMYHELMPKCPTAKRNPCVRLKEGVVPMLPTDHPAAPTASTSRRQYSVQRAQRAAHQEALKQILEEKTGTLDQGPGPSTSDEHAKKKATPSKKVQLSAALEHDTTAAAKSRPTFSTPMKRSQPVPSGSPSYSFLATPRSTTLDHPYFRRRQLLTPTSTESSQSSDQENEDLAEPLSSTDDSSSPHPCGSEGSSSATVEPPEALEEFIPSDESTESEDEKQTPVPPEQEEKFIVFESNLDELMRFCPKCGSPVESKRKDFSGSMVTYHLECMAGCDVKWASQPTIKRQPIGNVLIAAAILFTGLTFSRVASWASTLNLRLISQSTFTAIQKSKLWPVVQEVYTADQKEAIKEVKKRRGAITLGGDSRCDTPGHCARYGSYSLMDIRPNAPSLIVAMELVHASEVKNSHHMEVEGLRRCINKIRQSKVKVTTLATDQHPMVTKMMREEYSKIDHQLDMWHCSKNLKKKLTKKANKKGCSELSNWIAAICNHLWYCASSCRRSVQILKEKWLSMLHHVTDVHSWTGGVKVNACEHGVMEVPEGHMISYLKKDSESFHALQSIVAAPAFLKLMPQMTKFCHTGKLEVFHSFLLKYCSKRQYFPYPGMKARLMLATLSWNELQRQDATDKQHVVRYSRKRNIFVLEDRKKRASLKELPDHLNKLLQRTMEVINNDIVLPPIEVPELKRRGDHLQKPSVEDLLDN